jgi:Arc/MetJ-type ribon-helix-helix transcriptional regulator
MGSMKLVNVRLDERDARVAARLRAKGISLSDVVRRALRAEDQRQSTRERSEEVLAQMMSRFPTPKGAARTSASSLDRRAVQKLIRSRLKRST